MQKVKLLIILIQLNFGFISAAQQIEFVPDLSTVKNTASWSIHNRKASYDSVVHLDGKEGDKGPATAILERAGVTFNVRMQMKQEILVANVWLALREREPGSK